MEACRTQRRRERAQVRVRVVAADVHQLDCMRLELICWEEAVGIARTVEEIEEQPTVTWRGSSNAST